MRFLLFLLFFSFAISGHTLSLKADAPARYVVQPGDSLWSIACKYLDNPWEWKALWRANPHVKNPHRLYAGDVLVLASYHHKPCLKVLAKGIVKLSPNIRVLPAEQAIPPIPLSELMPFLNESLVLDINGLGRAPYVVAFMGERLMGGQGDQAYVKGLHPSKKLPRGAKVYSIFRQGSRYEDPITHEPLGYKASLVGYARLVAGGEPATILLTSINMGIKILDRVLINNSPEFNLYFLPKAPTVPVLGQIIDIPENMPYGHSQGAVGSVVVMNRGARDGLTEGDVLGVYRKPQKARDPQNALVPVTLPPERVGEVLVFRVFTKTSFGLVMRSTHAVYLYNVVTNP